MDRSMRRLAALVGVLGLVAVSCDGGDDTAVSVAPSSTAASTTAAVLTTTTATTTTIAPTTTTTATTTTIATTTTAAVVAIDCDTPAVQIGLGQSVDSELQPTGEPYPGNATYYCVAVPGGIDRVTIDLTGFFVDLDLYVGFGSIESVQGVDISRGETYEWKSNDFGTVDERVVISGPEPGVYYIEIASYDNESSPFMLTVSD